MRRAVFAGTDFGLASQRLHNVLSSAKQRVLVQLGGPKLTNRELKLLLRKVRRAEESSGILLKHSLVMHLELFRGETMHLLMYKDWAEFEGFVDEVKRSFEEMDGFDITLHKFASYLETLIHHVGMREVLRNTNAGGRAPEVRGARADDDSAAGLTAL